MHDILQQISLKRWFYFDCDDYNGSVNYKIRMEAQVLVSFPRFYT